MSMKLNPFEIANVLIVIFLLFQLVRRRDVVTLLLVLFAYGSLHFGFAVIALTTHESASLMIAMHNDGGGGLAKLSTLVLLSVIFVFLGGHAYGSYVQNRRSENQTVIYILTAMGALFLGYLLNYRYDDWLQLKNVISLEVMFAFILIGYLGVLGDLIVGNKRIYAWGMVGLIVLAVADGVAIYEVFCHNAWSQFRDSSGAIIYRASSILFNPNLFGFWASLIYLGCAYGMHTFKSHRMMILGMILASIAIYFSGSRSAGYLLLALLLFTPLLIKERLHWVPFLIFPLTISIIYFGAARLLPSVISSNIGWNEIAMLGERFFYAPINLINYVFMHVGVPAGVPAGVPVEVSIAIEGRFVGEGRDAGWLILYQDVGWLGVIAILWGSMIMMLWGMRTYVAKRSAASVYAIAALCCCLFTGLVMRFQIFPVWLFISVTLTLCLGYWKRSAVHNEVLMGSDARTNN
ncbi:MAG: hypothetical protein WC736_02635 [Gallionella sp.]